MRKRHQPDRDANSRDTGSSCGPTLIVAGPRAPAVGGGAVSVETLLAHLAQYRDLNVVPINTAPPGKGSPTKLIRLETARRAVAILSEYWRAAHKGRTALLFAANQSVVYLVPILWLISALKGVRLFVKPLGGDLDLFLRQQCPFLQKWTGVFLGRVAGVFPQTLALRDELVRWRVPNVVHVPGFRACARHVPRRQNPGKNIRLIYLAHIRLEKGPLLLLEALRRLDTLGTGGVRCDFYGPIFPDVERAFKRDLEATPTARYMGVWERHEETTQLLAEYDALVLPTHYPGEGHPGAIVEALLAGLPVVATKHRGIPELVQDNRNGLLVPCRDVDALVEAIATLQRDVPLRLRLANGAKETGAQLDVGEVAPTMLRKILPDLFEVTDTYQTECTTHSHPGALVTGR